MRLLVLPACLWLALAVPAFGQDSDSDEPLTLGVALDEAFRRNPDLTALRRQYEAVHASAAQERHLGAPSFEAQIWEWPVTTLNPVRTGMYVFTAEQYLPGRGKRAAREFVAWHESEVVRREISVRASGILDEVRQAYAELALARETVALYERQVPVMRELADVTTLQFASGRVGQHDTVMSAIELSRIESDALTWRTRARTAEAWLNVLLGRPADQAVESLQPMVWTAVPFNAEQVALERHPAMARAAAEIAREEAELERLRGERRPDFVVGGGYMLTPGDAGAWTARAGITWPNAPWSRSRLDAAIDAQARRVEAAVARREAVASVIRRGVHDAEVHIEAARERVRLIEETLLPHVEHGLDLSRVAYAAGRGGFGDVLDSQRALLAVQVEYAGARTGIALALAALERAIGGVREEPALAGPQEDRP